MPEDNPRIAVVMNAPQNLEQQLPQGEYHIIAIAEGYIRGVYEYLQIVRNQVTPVVAELLKLAENPIIIENLAVDEGCIDGKSTGSFPSNLRKHYWTGAFLWMDSFRRFLYGV